MGWRDPGSVPDGRTADRVVICGDPEASAPVRALLDDSGFDVVFVDAGRDSLAEALAERPALVVVDMDGRNAMGFVVCSMLRDRHGELLPIVLMSGERTGTSDRVAGLLLGADDYVVKPFEATEVVARVRRLLRRSTAAVAAEAAPGNGDVVNDFDLTPREQEVLSLLVGGLTQLDIANELVISTNTVAAHIQRILHKMGVRNRAQAVAKAVRAGWVASSDGAGSMTHALDGAVRAAAPRRPPV